MELWAWLVAYLVGFALLQFYLYRYFVRDDSRTNGTALESSAEGSASPRDRVTTDTDRSRADDRVHCSACGAPNRNEPVYTYCRECGKALA
ncbi:MAG: hypothetical protein V5A55_10135 [Halovenus sp.]